MARLEDHWALRARANTPSNAVTIAAPSTCSGDISFPFMAGCRSTAPNAMGRDTEVLQDDRIAI
jgi:hypothetical protein